MNARAAGALSMLGLVLAGCGSSSGATGPLDAGTDARSAGASSGGTSSDDASAGGGSGGTGSDGSSGDDGSDAGAAATSADAAPDARGVGVGDVALRTNNCFPAPGACGFPDPAYGTVGVPSNATLTASASITVGSPGTLVHDLDVTGSIAINASHTTLRNVRLTVTAKGSGVAGISIGNGVTDTTIEDTTIVGGGATNSPESAIFNHFYGSLTLTRVYLYDFADPLEGPATITDSYIDSNGTYGSGSNVAHIEDVYVSDGTVTVNHSVLLNPSGQTATVFMDTSGGSQIAGDDHLVITSSLLAGGGWTLYPSAKSTSVGTATMNVSDNRFARCLTSPVFDGSGTTCSGGADTHGYFPNGGYYGVAADDYCPPTAGQMWSGNVWDDDDSALPCP